MCQRLPTMTRQNYDFTLIRIQAAVHSAHAGKLHDAWKLRIMRLRIVKLGIFALKIHEKHYARGVNTSNQLKHGYH